MASTNITAGRQAGRQADRQTDRQTARQAGKQTGRQKGRKAERCWQAGRLLLNKIICISPPPPPTMGHIIYLTYLILNIKFTFQKASPCQIKKEWDKKL